jgi:hypothetical protein
MTIQHMLLTLGGFVEEFIEPPPPSGATYAWGNNSYGRLGDGSAFPRSSPVSIVGGFTDWTQVSGGLNASFGVRLNGTLWSWGSNANGQLGDGTTVSKSSPVLVAGGFTDWIQVSGGGWGTAVGLRLNGTLGHGDSIRWATW